MNAATQDRPPTRGVGRARRGGVIGRQAAAALLLGVALSLEAQGSAPTKAQAVAQVQVQAQAVAQAQAQAQAVGSDGASAAAELVHYRLAETWRDAPWELEAGRFARAADISADASGTIYVLDALHAAVHRRGPDGRWRVRRLDRSEVASTRRPERLDVSPGGDILVLWRGELEGERSARIERYRSDGELVAGFETGLDHNDVAIGPGGAVYLTRRVPRIAPPDPDGPRPPGGLDVLGPSGALVASIEGGDELSLPSGVDVDADGTVYVIDWRPSPEPAPPPDPRPTARPSSRLEDEAITTPTTAGVEALPGPVRSAFHTAARSDERAEGIVVFGPDLAFRERVDFYGADDVAVGPAGVFVSRQLEFFDLDDPEAVWTGPAGAISIPYYGAPLHLEAPLRGAPLVAALDHCWFQGVLDMPSLAGRPGVPAFDGRLDRPALAGPRRPARIDVGFGPDGEVDAAGLRVLHDRWQPEVGAGYMPEPAALAGPWGSQPQSVQRWSNAGRLEDQAGVCGDDQAWFERRSEVRRALDVAVAVGVEAEVGAETETGAGARAGASVTIVIEPELVRAFADDPARPLPLWTLWAGAIDSPAEDSDPALRAVDADGGLIAVLDGGAGRVILAPARPVADVTSESRSIELGPSAAAAVDVALRLDRLGSAPTRDGDLGRIALADAGERRVRILDLHGAVVTEWPVHDTPHALAFGPGGDLFVLGEGGWMMRYSATGELVARWSMPVLPAEIPRTGAPTDQALAHDVTVDARGRVFVAFSIRREHSASTIGELWWRIQASGIWVFEPDVDRVIAERPTPDACLVATDKSASPSALRRGGLVDVRLDVGALCPPSRLALRSVLVLDVSRSMSWDGALPRAQAAASRLVESLSGAADRIGLITFADRPAVVAPLDTDRGAVLRALGAARAGGDTWLGPALAAAEAELAAARPGPGPAPAPRSVSDADGDRTEVIVLTDGRPSDYPLAEADALRASGATLRFVVLPRSDYQAVFTTVLANLAGGDRDKVIVAPDAAAVNSLLAGITEAHRPALAFETLEVVDAVPDTMRYVEGSAAPPAVWDPGARTLTWSLGPVERDAPVRLTYRLEPLLDGVWPTNVWATAHGRDGTGAACRLDFPIPSVSVWSPDSLVERIYLPFSSARRCLRPAPRDIVLVVDTSSSMAEPAQPGTGPTDPRKIDAAAAAAAALIERADSGRDRFAAVTFDARADVLFDFGTSAAEISGRLGRLTTAPGTAIDRGLEAAGTVLDGARPDAVRAVLLLSDGRHAGDADPVLSAAGRIVERGGRIFAVAVGLDADHVLLSAVAASGAFGATSDADGIASLFALMDERMRCLPVESLGPRAAALQEE